MSGWECGWVCMRVGVHACGCACVWVCMRVCVCVYVGVDGYVSGWECMWMGVHACGCACVWVCMRVGVHACGCACVWACAQACARTIHIGVFASVYKSRQMFRVLSLVKLCYLYSISVVCAVIMCVYIVNTCVCIYIEYMCVYMCKYCCKTTVVFQLGYLLDIN